MYQWSIGGDELVWGENVAQVLGLPDGAEVSTGRGFASLLHPDNPTSRYDAVMDATGTDGGEGVSYQVQYRLRPSGEAGPTLWLEDTGRWFAGADGRPAHAHGVVRVINERREREDRLAFLSRHDALTGLVNRGAMAEIMSAAIAGAQDERESAGFILIGIDNLALINDAYGFDVADEVIAAISKRLRSRLRGSDTLGRVSGNKFGVVLQKCSESDMVIAADRLLHAVRDDVVQTEGGPIAATASIGGVIAPRYARCEKECLQHAHEALAEAKRRGPGTFVAFHHIRERTAERRANIKLAGELIEALNEDRFRFAFQPLVSARTGETALYECLLRLERKDASLMRAGAFVPMVEKLGLARLIDHRVLQLALAELGAAPDLRLSLNISGASAASPEWLDFLSSAVRNDDSIARRLVVEITETMAIQNISETTRFVGALRDLGCRVAIDDFGAGYTSFRNLRLIKVDMVKIDGAYVENMARSRDDQIFVRTLVDLARNFGLETVAEWVADAESAEMLRDYGVDLLQGAYCGMPTLDRPWAPDCAKAALSAAS